MIENHILIFNFYKLLEQQQRLWAVLNLWVAVPPGPFLRLSGDTSTSETLRPPNLLTNTLVPQQSLGDLPE